MFDFTQPVRLFALFLVAAVLPAVATPAQAQAHFSLGPQVSVGGSTSSYFDYGNYSDGGRHYQTDYLVGFEAGVAGALRVGRLTVQPALLFSQRGFHIKDNYSSYYWNAVTTARLRLNYLSLPISVAYALQPDGQGLQFFGGPYVSLLLGGTYTYDNSYVGYRRPLYTIQGTLPVAGSGPYRDASNDPASAPAPTTYYSRRMDAGCQAGLGYRFGSSLVRVSYSLGLLNLGVGSQIDRGQAGVYSTEPPKYYNQALQLSFAYLFGPGS